MRVFDGCVYNSSYSLDFVEVPVTDWIVSHTWMYVALQFVCHSVNLEGCDAHVIRVACSRVVNTVCVQIFAGLYFVNFANQWAIMRIKT